MADAKSEPFYADVRSNDRGLVLAIVGDLIERLGAATAEIHVQDGLYRVVVAEAAEPAT